MNDEKKPEVLSPRRPAKRVIVPLKDQSAISTHSILSTDLLLNDAKLIIASELARYRSKAVRGISLDLKEARVVQGYLAELTKLSREEREDARAQDLSNLSDEELLQMAKQVLIGTSTKKIEE